MLTNLHFSILDIALVMFMFLGIVIFFSWVPGRGMLLNVEQLLSLSKKKKAAQVCYPQKVRDVQLSTC